MYAYLQTNPTYIFNSAPFNSTTFYCVYRSLLNDIWFQASIQFEHLKWVQVARLESGRPRVLSLIGFPQPKQPRIQADSGSPGLYPIQAL